MQKSLYDVQWAAQAFSDAECDRILARLLASPLKPGLLMQQDVADETVRKSAIHFVPYNEEDKWVFDRLRDVAILANQDLKFELKGFDEGFQLARYAEGEFYDWHADLGAGASAVRKLSLVTQLTQAADYDGGELEFFPKQIQAPRGRGTVVVFPAYMPHRVLPVTRGVRYSMASWIAGAVPFR